MNTLKILKYLIVMIAASLVISCSKDDDPVVLNDLDGLKLATTISNSTHKVELYTLNGKLQTGFNNIFFQLKNTDGTTIDNATAAWIPEMNMMSMKHSCPYSPISKAKNSTSTYTGFIVFQMAGNDSEYWELTLNYSVNGIDYSIKSKIQVIDAAKRSVETFQGTDGNRYILAMVDPIAPKVAINEMKAVLYRMDGMMNFPVVNSYKILIDPRMPGMGNHSSPNNTDLLQGIDKMYQGKLSLTMTGYWKINLQLIDPMGNLIKGEKITETNESSSIYFELEF
ncbi:hypothetical protein ACR79B_07355 [Sphingobacterium spiritivorum]|uniref:hypothetical protein n=1 Tax=Sphingobacterium spiritivorum TaxID=258 RepID=UPI003DA4CA7E